MGRSTEKRRLEQAVPKEGPTMRRFEENRRDGSSSSENSGHQRAIERAHVRKKMSLDCVCFLSYVPPNVAHNENGRSLALFHMTDGFGFSPEQIGEDIFAEY